MPGPKESRICPPQRDDQGLGGWKIDPNRGREEYVAVRRSIEHPDAEGLIEAIKVADLRGLGWGREWAHRK